MTKLNQPLDESQIKFVKVATDLSPYVLAITDIVYDTEDYVMCTMANYETNVMSKPRRAVIHYNGNEDYFTFNGRKQYLRDFMKSPAAC